MSQNKAQLTYFGKPLRLSIYMLPRWVGLLFTVVGSLLIEKSQLIHPSIPVSWNALAALLLILGFVVLLGEQD